MDDFEKLGLFYLGRPYNLKTKKAGDGLLLYDSKHLVTHGVCVGMTGSGKTGLCISLLEEAAIDGIPSIIIDPKGDMANLMLTFPSLKPTDFAPWINEGDARKKGLTPSEYAAKQASLWKNGLASWGQSGERIGLLQQSADFTVYTPGSTAGQSVSIMESFASPSTEIINDSELLRDRVNTTVSSLLSLLNKDTDPLHSREHILISTILDRSWRLNKNLDIESLIQQIHTPPVDKIGVFDLESFYPAKDRFDLALTLNNLLAAPGFRVWMQGEPLDINRILHTAEGKPRVSIFSIAHLNESERMFFVSLLLNQILTWMRTQSGTTSLRAIIYMDEIFGYFPPVANPPSKAPLLTMLKQARAFGVGVLLATQNPVDLDYKGLSNTGTWFIGRLQTERDKMRVLEGLEGAAASTSTRFDRQDMEQILAGLGKRIFLMNNVNHEEPTIFQTRWAMSYLRGPLTRNQIKILMASKKRNEKQSYTHGVTSDQPKRERAISNKKHGLPVLPPGLKQSFIAPRKYPPLDSKLFYTPMLLGNIKVLYQQLKLSIDTTEESSLVTSITEDIVPVDWDNSTKVDLSIADLERSPRKPAIFAELPPAAGKIKNYNTWGKQLVNMVYQNHKLELFKSPSLREVSRPEESERDFRIRLQQIAREKRDICVENLKNKYTVKINRLEEKIRRARLTLDRENDQVKQQKMQTAISFGSALFSSFLGKKRVSYSSMGRATTAARGTSRIFKEKKDIERAKDSLKTYQQRLKDLEDKLRVETNQLVRAMDPLTETFGRILVKPKKKDIVIRILSLVWIPNWQDSDGKLNPA